MEESIQFLKGFNIQTIISVFLMLWYFAQHIGSKIDKQCERTDKLYEIFISFQKEMKDDLMSVQKEMRDGLMSAQKETKDMFIELLKEKRGDK